MAKLEQNNDKIGANLPGTSVNTNEVEKANFLYSLYFGGAEEGCLIGVSRGVFLGGLLGVCVGMSPLGNTGGSIMIGSIMIVGGIIGGIVGVIYKFKIPVRRW